VALDSVRHMVGDGARKLVERGLESTGGVPGPAAFEAAVDRFFSHYGDHLSDHSEPFPGVTAALERYAAAGHVMGVCTNKPEAFSVKILENLGLSRYFAAVVGGDTLAVKKPDGGHIHGTLARMKAGPERAVMIGDSANDVAASRDAGIPVIAVTFGYTRVAPGDLGADRLIDHFDDLDAAIDDVLSRPARRQA
jgi:phosphoglycolate phosphatase